jgi:glycolate oxidase FAD binding subunit
VSDRACFLVFNASTLITASPCDTLKQQFPELQLQPWDLLGSSVQHQLNQLGLTSELFGCAAYPQTQLELGALLTLAYQQGWHILTYGSGSKLSWGGLPKPIDCMVSTAHLNRLVDHAVGDMTVTVEAGMKLADLQEILAKEGQFLPLDPLYGDQATIGGIIATASAGSLRQRYGGVRDLLLGISVARADGQLAKAGGRVVKNVAGYDLMKLMTGSFGTLGILTQATFRVYAAPAPGQTVMLSGDRTILTQAFQHIQRSALNPTALDFISPHLAVTLGETDETSLLIRFQTIAAGLQAQVEQVQQLAQALNLKTRLYQDEDENHLWQQLRTVIEQNATTQPFLVKIGIKARVIGDLMRQMQALLPTDHLGWIHGSGLGWVRSQEPDPAVITQLRQLCQAEGGFVSILEASPALKRHMEVWGYSGNAQPMMQQLKQQFDPNGVLNLGRFVGGI